jgi:hypothetical protein
MSEKSTAPNPGSGLAIDKGCTCPVFDNGHGRLAPRQFNGKDAWWVTQGCPLHDLSAHRSKAGKASADALTPEQRKARAIKARAARTEKARRIKQDNRNTTL